MSYNAVADDAYKALEKVSDTIFKALFEVSKEELRGLTDTEIRRYFTDSGEIHDNNRGALVLVCDYDDFGTLKKMGFTDETAEIVMNKYAGKDITDLVMNNELGDCTLVINSRGEVGALPPTINNNLPLPEGASVYDFIPNEISFKNGYIPSRLDIYRNVGSKTTVAARTGVAGGGHVLVSAKKQSGPPKTVAEFGPYGARKKVSLEIDPHGDLGFYRWDFKHIDGQWTSNPPKIIYKVPRKVACDVPVGQSHQTAIYDLGSKSGIMPQITAIDTENQHPSQEELLVNQ